MDGCRRRMGASDNERERGWTGVSNSKHRGWMGAGDDKAAHSLYSPSPSSSSSSSSSSSTPFHLAKRAATSIDVRVLLLQGCKKVGGGWTRGYPGYRGFRITPWVSGYGVC